MSGNINIINILKGDIQANWIRTKHDSTLCLIFEALWCLSTSRGFREIFFYRIGHFCRNIPILISLLTLLQGWFSTIEIPFGAQIGPGLVIAHAYDIVLHPGCVLGARALIYQGVTIGGNFYVRKKPKGRAAAIIGDDVILYSGAKIIGGITIGDNVIIGANSVVIMDIPSNSVAVGIPARVVGTNDEGVSKCE